MYIYIEREREREREKETYIYIERERKRERDSLFSYVHLLLELRDDELPVCLSVRASVCLSVCLFFYLPFNIYDSSKDVEHFSNSLV